MKIHLMTIGQRMPSWVNEAYEDYSKRLPNDYALLLKELPAEKRNKSANLEQIMEKESERLLAHCPSQTHRIALDRQGKRISTKDIANTLQTFHDQSQDIALLIGGPEGISSKYLQQADNVWSLSELTLPHPLVRVVVAEQIYRAWSVIVKHPYHR